METDGRAINRSDRKIRAAGANFRARRPVIYMKNDIIRIRESSDFEFGIEVL